MNWTTGSGTRRAASALAASLAVFVAPGCASVVLKEAARDLAAARKGAALAVYPVVLHEGSVFRSDPGLDRAVLEVAGGFGFGSVKPAAGEAPPVRTPFQMNEAAMYRKSAAAVSEFTRSHPPDGDYALYTEFLLGPNGQPLAVHWVIVDRQARVAAGSLVNSHWDAFKSVDPKSAADCPRVLAASVRETLQD